MKKLFAFSLAALMLGTLAVTSVADVDPSYVDPNATAALPGTRAANTVNVSFGQSTDTDAGDLEGMRLKPGKEYRFGLLLDGNPITEETMKSYNIRFSVKKGGGTLNSFSLVKYSGVYKLVADVKTAWPTKATEVQYEIRILDKKTNQVLSTHTVSFETGYMEANDATINSLSYEDEIAVDPEYPVFTKSQLERIASINNYRNVTFVGNTWRYTTNVADMKDVNLVFNHNGISELLGQYPNYDFEFINFPAGPTFPINGKFEVDVNDFAEDFGNKFYVYRYLTGTLTNIPSTYDANENTLTFNTNTLGRFVISDQPLNATVGTPPSSGTPGTSTPSTPGNGTTDGGKPIPPTGAIA